MRDDESLSVTRLTRYSTACAVPTSREDRLAVEEPLEITLQAPGCKPFTLAITMRTPGDDRALAAGFLFTEGLVKHKNEIACQQQDADSPRPSNTQVITLAKPLAIAPEQLHRHFFANSACGVCGKTAMQALELRHRPQLSSKLQTTREVLQGLPDTLRTQQQQFAQSGGVHASALFSATGELLLLKEDVGRHNALDKLIGQLLLEDHLPLARDAILLVSGRSSFELVQKALMADIPMLAAIGAPTSLACELAARHDMTLIGFLRSESFNVYTGPDRLS